MNDDDCCADVDDDDGAGDGNCDDPGDVICYDYCDGGHVSHQATRPAKRV